MGMYTALVLDATLRNDTPREAIDVLKYMIDPIPDAEPPLPNHELFSTPRWLYMLNSESAYFPIDRAPILTPPGTYVQHYTLSVGLSMKSYDREIDKFIDWLTPYIVEALGYTMYEEDAKLTPLQIGWWMS